MKGADVVWFWLGGPERGCWCAADPTPTVAAQIANIRRGGRVAYPGKRSIGSPEGPPSPEEFAALEAENCPIGH